MRICEAYVNEWRTRNESVIVCLTFWVCIVCLVGWRKIKDSTLWDDVSDGRPCLFFEKGSFCDLVIGDRKCGVIFPVAGTWLMIANILEHIMCYIFATPAYLSLADRIHEWTEFGWVFLHALPIWTKQYKMLHENTYVLLRNFIRKLTMMIDDDNGGAQC